GLAFSVSVTLTATMAPVLLVAMAMGSPTPAAVECVSLVVDSDFALLAFASAPTAGNRASLSRSKSANNSLLSPLSITSAYAAARSTGAILSSLFSGSWRTAPTVSAATSNSAVASRTTEYATLYGSRGDSWMSMSAVGSTVGSASSAASSPSSPSGAAVEDGVGAGVSVSWMTVKTVRGQASVCCGSTRSTGPGGISE